MPGAYGLYSHVQQNRLRSVLLVIGLIALIYVLTFGFSLLISAFVSNRNFAGIVADAWALARQSVPYVSVAALLWVTICYFWHERMIDAVTGAHAVTREAEPRLWNLLENLCISRGLAMPRLAVMETDVRNAFASGMNARQHRITVTRGLMAALDDRELEAVLAHELTHIRNGDINVMVIAALVAGVITFFAELVFRAIAEGPRLPRSSRSRSSWSFGSGSKSKSDGKSVGAMLLAIAIALLIIATVWFLSMALKFALSRSREYLADAGSVELTKNPDAMISALRKISGKAELPRVPSGIMEMCIDNQKNSIADLFSTHPSVKRRVEKLMAVAGGHDRAAEAISPSPSAV
jgi:heat shock protein HtpX